jgi:glycosyltransferase A (GT-A) superfamily protein (DUF2064 family)
MDTPQLRPGMLHAATLALAEDGRDAVLGPAADGGYWAIGLRRPRSEVFEAVPMSTPWTARAQRLRLRLLGLRWAELPSLRDIDLFEDAREAAVRCPGSRFAVTLREIESELALGASRRAATEVAAAGG